MAHTLPGMLLALRLTAEPPEAMAVACGMLGIPKLPIWLMLPRLLMLPMLLRPPLVASEAPRWMLSMEELSPGCMDIGYWLLVPPVIVWLVDAGTNGDEMKELACAGGNAPTMGWLWKLCPPTCPMGGPPYELVLAAPVLLAPKDEPL